METRYSPPSTPELLQFITSLDAAKSDRVEQVKFLKDFAELVKHHEDAQRALIGALIFTIEDIESTYDGWIWSSVEGCRLYQFILTDGLQTHPKAAAEKKIENNQSKTSDATQKSNENKNVENQTINENKEPVSQKQPKEMLVKERLIYFNHFYKVAHEKKLQLPKVLATPKAFDEKIAKITDRILKRIPDLQDLLTTRPELTTIINSTEVLHQEYLKSCETRWFNPNVTHKKFELLLKFLQSKDCDNLIVKMLPKIKNKKKREEAFKVEQFKILYGAVLYMMSEIEKEYRHVWESDPRRSELYRFCQKILNIDHTRDVADFARVVFFAAFRKFVRATVKSSDAIDVLKTYIVKGPGVLAKAGVGGINIFRRLVGANEMDPQPTKFDDAPVFLKNIITQISLQYVNKSILMRATDNLCEYLKSSGRNALLYKGSGVLYQVAFAGALVGLAAVVSTPVTGGGIVARYAVKAAVAPQEAAAMIGGIATAAGFLYNFLHEMVNPTQDTRLDELDQFEEFNQKIMLEISKSPSDPADEPLMNEMDLYKALDELPSTVIAKDAKERFRTAIVKAILEKELQEIKPESDEDLEKTYVLKM